MKLLGISSSKIASVAFLLVTLFLALALSSVEFLKTNNMAVVPMYKEGLETEANTAPPTEEEKKEEEETPATPPAATDGMENKEGFSNTLPYAEYQ